MGSSLTEYLRQKYRDEDSDIGKMVRAYDKLEESYGEVSYDLEEMTEWKNNQRWRSKNMTTIYRPKSEVFAKLPSPRLQFVWMFNPDEGMEYACRYELVFDLKEGDGRGKYDELTECVVTLGVTRRGGACPWDNQIGLESETPFRDGAHARWDSATFGGLPVYVIAPDGRAVKSARHDGADQ
jgi:hypothetical protein